MTLAAHPSQPRQRVSRYAAASFYRNVRFCLEQAALLHDVPGREREFEGHCWSAFYLLDEAEKHRFGGVYGRMRRGGRR